MKHAIILLLTVMFCNFANGQDIITKRNGDDIKVKVLEVLQTEVKYKKFESPSGVTYTINKSDILMIRYKDGTKDIFTNETPVVKVDAEPENTSSKPKSKWWKDEDEDNNNRSAGNNSTYQPKLNTYNSNNVNLSEKGRVDADTYYRGFSGAKTGTLLIAGIISPLGGLIPAIICSSTSPSEYNLNAPNSELMREPDYHNAYKAEAFRIKKRKTWGGWAIGSAIAIVAYVIVSGSY